MALQEVRLAEFYLPCPHCHLLGTDRALECRGCGLIFAKWRRKTAPPQVTSVAVSPRPGPHLRWNVPIWIRVAAVVFGVALGAAHNGPSLELGQADFDAKVLKASASTPVLVMFNVKPGCGCADEELYQLNSQWKGNVAVYRMNRVDSPELGAKYGDPKDAIVLLFKDGQLVKKANAAEMERAIMSRHGGKYDSGEMKSALEDFVRSV